MTDREAAALFGCFAARAAQAEEAESEKAAPEGGRRFKLKDHEAPSYEALISKGKIPVVDVRRHAEGSLAQKEKVFRASEEAKRLTQSPATNQDTGEEIYITSATFTHSFSGQGINKLETVRNIRELVKTSVLTSVRPSRKEADHTTGIYTFFGAARTEDGIHPVKLTVKEYSNEGQDIPASVKEAIGEDWNTFASVYDGRVLVLENIEKETDGKQVGLAAEATPADPSVSEIKIADLYHLVNHKYQKYLPQPPETDYSSMQNRSYSITPELADWVEAVTGERPRVSKIYQDLQGRDLYDPRRVVTDRDGVKYLAQQNKRLRQQATEQRRQMQRTGTGETVLFERFPSEFGKALLNAGIQPPESILKELGIDRDTAKLWISTAEQIRRIRKRGDADALSDTDIDCLFGEDTSQSFADEEETAAPQASGEGDASPKIKTFGDYKDEHGVFDFNMALKDYRESLENHSGTLKDAPEKCRMYLLQALDAVPALQKDDEDLVIVYRPSEDAIHYNPHNPVIQLYDASRSLTHDLSHHIDHMFVQSWKQSEFSKAIADMEAIISENPNMYRNYCYKNDKSGLLSDLLSAGCSSKYEFPFRHDPEYWNISGNKEREAFANLFSLEAHADDEEIVFLMAHFPDLMSAYSRLDYYVQGE